MHAHLVRCIRMLSIVNLVVLREFAKLKQELHCFLADVEFLVAQLVIEQTLPLNLSLWKHHAFVFLWIKLKRLNPSA